MVFAADYARAVRGAHIARSRVRRGANSSSHRGRVINVSNAFSAQAAQLRNLVDADRQLAERLNQAAPNSRRSRRLAAKAASRKNHLVTGSAMAALVGTAAGAVAVMAPKATLKTPLAGSDTSQIATVSYINRQRSKETGAQVSRSETRRPLREQQTSNQGKWELDNSGLDVDNMFKSLANNPAVALLMDANRNEIPANFNPNHATGDTGNAYAFSQCTWWAYLRRHQLGLPVGSYLGNGSQWASAARALGYWVDNTPRNVGDIIVFQPGQEGTDIRYGHVGIVERINPDGSITTSECGAAFGGRTYSHTYKNVHSFQFIHY